MKKNDLFDILEDAENDSMDRLIDKCPEISDEQLDRILDMSERKFNMKKKEMTGREKNIEMTGNNVVEGVERVKRPAWLAPLSTAASLVLVAGIVIGSTALIRKNSKNPGDDSIVSQGAAVTTTMTEKPTATEAATMAATEAMNAKLDPESTDLTPFTGKWKFLASETNNVEVDGKTVGYIFITADGTYTLTGTDGTAEIGTVTRSFEEIGGTKVIKLDFAAGKPIEIGSYYYDEKLDVLHYGNGDSARLIRVNEDTKTEKKDVKELAGTWSYMELDKESLPDNKVTSVGRLCIGVDGSYTYTDNAGKTITGTVETGIEMIEETAMQTVSFLENGEFKFGGYYNWGEDTISIGNGGLAYLCRITENNVSIDEITGKWNYQVADEGTTVDKWSHLQGTVEILNDSTYTFTDLDGNTTNGRVELKYESSSENPVPMFYFYDGMGEDAEVRFAAEYHRNDPNVLSHGNSGHSCFRRPSEFKLDIAEFAGKWAHQRSDSAFADESDIFELGTMMIGEDGTYTYTDSYGKIASVGEIRTRCEEYANGSVLNMIEFYDGNMVNFTAYYDESNPDSLYIGNDGLMRFQREG